MITLMIAVFSALSLAQPSFYDSGLSACRTGHDSFPFCNTSLPLDDRVLDLISRIEDVDKPNLLTARGFLSNRGRQGLPQVGVPSYYWGSNCIHSAMFANCTESGGCSTSFPSGPSWAATFDRELMRNMAVVVGKETRAAFNMGNFTDNGLNGLGLDCWGPVLNLNRDPRWGRNAEGGTEDPYLMGELAVAWTQGLQQGDGEDSRYLQVAVTLKHFAANSLEGGSSSDSGFTRHTVSANVSKFLLQDYYWPAFKKAIQKAQAAGVMCSYNAVNNVPTCLDPLMRAARAQWGFDGYVTSDSDAVADAYQAHRFVHSAAQASCLAVKDGACDIDSGNTFFYSLLEGVQHGYCNISDINRALLHSLRVRFRLGLFDPVEDQPFWRFGAADIGTASAKMLNLRAAQSSLVLLHNSKVLPLRAGARIAVIGPHANATLNLIQHDTGLVCPSDKPWQHGGGEADHDYFDCVVSPFAAIAELNHRGSTVYEPGCGLVSNDTSGFAAALAAAREADVVVLGLGIFERTQQGVPEALLYQETEAHDRTSIDLPPVQKQLAKQLIALNKPTVIFLLNGGMVAVEDLLPCRAAQSCVEQTPMPIAIIEAFYPGMEGSTALAQSMFGLSNRWGKLPYTIYAADWAKNNSMLDHDVTHKRTYRYGAEAVLPFGHGLSLTDFTLRISALPRDLRLQTGTTSTSLTISVAVSNNGQLVGDEVVQVYLLPKQVQGVKQHPIKTLFDFKRVKDLGPGKTTTVKFVMDTSSMLLADENGNLVSAPGEYTLSFENGAGQVLHVPLQLVGSPVIVEHFPRFADVAKERHVQSTDSLVASPSTE